MFEQNIITFNPNDVLKIQKDLKEKGESLISEANISSPDGSISVTIKDPDGNLILLDQK